MCTCVPSFAFSFFSRHESFIPVIASSPFHRSFFSCFCIFVILAFHSITTSFLVFATLLPPHSTPLQFLFLFLQLHYHHIPLHHHFFSCFCNFVTTAFNCHPRMLLSRMDSFKNKFQAVGPLLTIAIVNCWSCKSQVSITNKLLLCCTFLYLLLWKKCKKRLCSQCHACSCSKLWTRF